MALSASRLSASIKSLWIADAHSGLSSPLSTDQDKAVKALCDAVATALVAEVVVHAQVTVTSVSGVTTGAGVSGPGSGTVA